MAVKTETALKDVKLFGKETVAPEKMQDELVVKTPREGDYPPFKAVFRVNSRRFEGEVPGKGRLFVEVEGDKVKFGVFRNTFYFVQSEKGGLEKPDIVMSFTNLGKLSGELGSEIRKIHNEIGAYYEAAKELKSKTTGTYAEGPVLSKGFVAGNEPKIFIKVQNDRIVELGLAEHRDEFSFIPSKEGGWGNPSVLLKPESLKKLSDTEPGVVMSMVYNNIPREYAPKVREFLEELDRVGRHPEVVAFLEEKSKSQSMPRIMG